MLAVGGVCLWIVGFSNLGERFNPNGNKAHIGVTLAAIVTSSTSVVPFTLIITDFNGQPVPFESAILKISIMYLIFSVGAFIGGFGFLRFSELVVKGKRALVRYDELRVRGPKDNVDWFEFQHGEAGEELRMRRLKAFEEALEAKNSEGKRQDP